VCVCVCGQNVKFLNVKPVGASRNHVKGLRQSVGFEVDLYLLSQVMHIKEFAVKKKTMPGLFLVTLQTSVLKRDQDSVLLDTKQNLQL